MPRLFLPIILVLHLVTPMFPLRSPSCHEVRAAFQLQQVGRARLVPEVPLEESDLQICQNKASTCCTRKMEESYQAAVKRELTHNIQALNFELKYMIVAHMSAFQETFTFLIDSATNHTMSLFGTTYRTLAQDVQDPVRELFTDISLNILGEEMPVDNAVSRFFDALFPLVYNHLLNPGKGTLSEEYLECLRLTRQDINPFGPSFQEMVTVLSKSLWASRMMKQSLSMAVHIINSTEHAGMTRECTRALVRMQYCPHCQGLTLIRPCVGYCLNVMRGCLASFAELDAPWRDFIALLEHLAGQMSGSHDLELALLGIRDMIKVSIEYAETQSHNLTSMVEKVCGELQESPNNQASKVKLHMDEDVDHPPVTKLPSPVQMRREFIKYMKLSRTFYASLAERLCDGDLAVRDGSTCWNGEDVVESYTNIVVSNELKAQVSNPEVKVRGPNAVISQVIDKLRHFIQMGNDKKMKPKRWRFGEGSGGGERPEDSGPSGDCDDEDGCQGSGEEETRDAKSRSEVSKELQPTVKVPRLPTQSTPKTSQKKLNVAGNGSKIRVPSSGLVVTLLIICQVMLHLSNAAATF
ncbi:glypican-5-like isoform X2 [Spea bombifrons]|uniref:glypican-5-like isoform X2 n=1 Tax=Spea bombifrons TaxID=233779 RepID=UPI00234B6834|nr:glypican-5-like isoform X2 [Spea bombifrons]